jgi:Protein of unknown function (DUF3489)
MNTTTTEPPHSTPASAAAQKPKTARKGRPAAQGAHGAPPKARSAPPAQKSAKSRHQARHARPGGASLQELQKATGWLPHSVRGFLSGALHKKMGLALTSTKDHGTERRYSLQD